MAANGGQALSTAALVMQATRDTGQDEEACIQAGVQILKGYELEPHEFEYGLGEIRKIAAKLYATE